MPVEMRRGFAKRSLRRSSVFTSSSFVASSKAPTLMMAYEYADLEGGRTIRVFEVQSASAEKIIGELKSVSLDKKPTYLALSYAWGNDTPTKTITCEGRELEVPVNSFAALLGIYNEFKRSMVWIDALCIDQTNDREKAAQIMLMRDIYGRAKSVVIWLGEGNDFSNYAFDWIAGAIVGKASPISVMEPGYKVFPENMEPREILKLLRAVPKAAQKKLSCFTNKTQLEYRSTAMGDVFGRQWFKRVWTLQELVLGCNAVVLCGHKLMPWIDFFSGIMETAAYTDEANDEAYRAAFDSAYTASALWVHVRAMATIMLNEDHNPRRSLWHWLIYSTEGRTVSFFRANRAALLRAQAGILALAGSGYLYRGRRPLDGWGFVLLITSCILTMLYGSTQRVKLWKPPSTIIILNKLRNREAKMPQDKVFALYGVFQKLGYHLPNPDYSKTLAEVYTEFTWNTMLQSESLDILAEVGEPKLAGAPSWVPDWSETHYRLHSFNCSASGTSIPTIMFDKDKNYLNCIGTVVDNINSSTILLLEGCDDLYSASSLHNIGVLQQWISSFLENPSTPTQSLIHRAISETLRFNDNTLLLEQWVSIMITDFSGIPSPDSADRQCAHLLAQDEDVKRYHFQRCKAVAGIMSLFTTKNCCVGSGPPSTVIGQDVILLAGCRFPVISKPAKLHEYGYSVVGVAWIPGLMNGEKWPDDPAGLQHLTLH